MKNMTQKNQNSSFDTKTGSRILRIIGATKLAVSPSISSYKREGPHASAVPPPPSSTLTCMLKMLLMYFKFINLILVFLTYAKITISPINCPGSHEVN